MNLAADCSACAGLCCVGPAFAASAEFAIDKAAGHACPHLRPDARCGIHDRLLPSGFGGCVAYDCFGAGQRIVALRGPGRTPATFAAYDVLRQLHELLWYVEDALGRAAAAPVHADLRTARDTIEALDPARADPASQRAAVAPLLRGASALVRAGRTGTAPGADLRGADLVGRGLPGADLRGADLVGRGLAGADLRRADLSTAYLIGADLRGADLREADLLGADLRGADLGGADLSGALYLTRTQVGGARGDATTRLALPRPAHWLRAGSSAP